MDIGNGQGGGRTDDRHRTPDTEPGGLHQFDLGTVPASVTPPRTWRRAAWFTITSSGAVLSALTFAAVVLTPTHPGGVVPKPSGHPPFRGLPMVPNQPVSTAHPDLRGLSVPEPSVGGATSDAEEHGAPEDQHTNAPPPGTASDPAPGSAYGALTRPPDAPSQAYTSSAPTSGPAAQVSVTADVLEQATVRFYTAVADGVDDARVLLGAELGQQVGLLERRFGDVTRTRVRQVEVDERTRTTVAVLDVVRRDGTTTVERRRLRFTEGDDPRVVDETLLSRVLR